MPTEAAKNRILDKLRREVGPDLLSALEDDAVIEILLNPDGRLWVERFGSPIINVARLGAAAAESVIATVASYVDSPVTTASPILECEFPLDSSRFEALLPPVVTGPTFSIRKRAIKALTLADYMSSSIMKEVHYGVLRKAVLERKNILVIGGTASGKTTFTNAVIQSIVEQSPDHRLVIIEDTCEIQCAAPNAVTLRTSETADMTRLLRATLRLRPDRIIVGEVRGGEALALLKAWNTGHPGGIATLHANHAQAGLIRLEQLIAEVTQTPMQALIAEAVDILVVIAKTANGRRITQVGEVQHFGKNGYEINFVE